MGAKLEKQKSLINNLKMFYNARGKVIKLFHDCSIIVFRVKYEAKHETGLKILTNKCFKG